jgi:hypothetical protein
VACTGRSPAIESSLLIRIVDLLILDHPVLYAFLALGFLQAYLAPQLLKEPAWRPPHSAVVAALVWSQLSVVDSALGSHPASGKRDLIVALFIAAMLVGGWACVGLLRYLLRLAVLVGEEQALEAGRGCDAD